MSEQPVVQQPTPQHSTSQQPTPEQPTPEQPTPEQPRAHEPAHARTSDHVAGLLGQWRRERPDLDTSPTGVVGRIHRLGDLLRPMLIDVYRAHGLGEGEFDVLATLRRQGPPYALQPSELAQHTMVTSGGMTKRLDRLETAGLVTRTTAGHDGRRRLVELTELGRQRIDGAYEAHIANEAAMVEQIPDADRRALERILGAWLERLER